MSVKTINQHEAVGASNVAGTFYVLVEQKDLTGVNEVHKKVLAGELVGGLVAPMYDPTVNYVPGDSCIHDGLFFVCNAATTGNFDLTKWDSTIVATLSTAHIQNSTIHVTASDKVAWNAKVDNSTNAEIETAWANA